MNILIIGSGGREHALAWKMAASPLTDKLYCAPGNAGIAQEAECVPLDIGDHAAVIAFCKEKKIGLVVVGPEVPLCNGIVDDLEGAGIKAFGPTTTKSTFFSLQKAITAAWSAMSSGTHAASCAMPALPGAQ